MIKLYRYVIYAVLIIGTCGCYMRKPVFPLLDYTWSSGWEYSYSLKVDDQGKAFLQKNNLKTDSFFVRTKINLNELNILMKEIDKAKLDSQYIQNNIQDAPSFKVMIYPERALPTQYRIYGDNYPGQLKKLEDYCRMLSKKQGWLYLKDTIIDFESREKQFQVHFKGIHFPPPEKNLNF